MRRSFHTDERRADAGRRAHELERALRVRGEPGNVFSHHRREPYELFFFEQKTAYEVGLGIPAEPLFRSLSRFVVTGCAAKTSATVTFPSLNLISLFAFCFNIWLNGVASQPSLVSWIKHSVDRFVIVSIFIPRLRLILILNTFLGSSDSLVFSELFHSLAPRPLAARSISDFLVTYLAT